MEQKFKGMTLKLNACVKNIVKVYNSSNEFSSFDWYKDANKFAQGLSDKYNVPLSVACGVIASLSPLKSWEENKLIANQFLLNGKGKHTACFIQKANDIKNSDGDIETIAMILNGNKIVSFFINMYDHQQSDFITIDRHALSIAIGRNIEENEGKGITLKQYEFFVTAYKLAGAKLKVQPIKVQSVSWQNWREAKKTIKNQDVPF